MIFWLSRGGQAKWRSVLMILMAFLLPQVNANELLKVTLTEQAYPPLITGSGRPSGLLTDVVMASFKLVNVEPNFIVVPNNRAITGLIQGLYEGSYGWAHSPERDDKLIYSSKPIYYLRIVFFQLISEDIQWDQLRDLNSVRIGVTQGNYYSDEFASLVVTGKLQIDTAPSDVSNFKKLLFGRIQLFPIDQDVGMNLLKNNFSLADQQKIKYQSKAISIIPVYLVLRKDLLHATEIRDRFDQGYQQLADSGQLKKMVEAYKAKLSIQP